jgi:hypothetical protein
VSSNKKDGGSGGEENAEAVGSFPFSSVGDDDEFLIY